MKWTNARTLGVGWRLEGQTKRNLPMLFMNEVSVDTKAPDAYRNFKENQNEWTKVGMSDLGRLCASNRHWNTAD